MLSRIWLLVFNHILFELTSFSFYIQRFIGGGEFIIATKWPKNWSARLIFGAYGTARRARRSRGVLVPSSAESRPNTQHKSEFRVGNEPLGIGPPPCQGP